MASEDNFFSRWSRRKADQAPKVVLAPQPAAKVQPPLQALSTPLGASAGAGQALVHPAPVDGSAAKSHTGANGRTEVEQPTLPTLDYAAALTPESDFKPFMQRAVAPDAKNAAMRKLFADPHFNIMDGLDTCIDDYSHPLPTADESTPGLTGTVSTRGPESYDHPDRQLQPDLVARRQGAESGA